MLRWSLALAALFCAGDALAEETRFQLVNGTQYRIREIHISSHDMDSWGPNVMGQPSVKPGEAREVALQAYFVSCNIDIKAVFDDIDKQPVWQYLNLCNLRKIRLNYDQMSGITTASYEE
jgi:hypothetical protein